MQATRTTPLRERMRQELQLAGLSERTQEAYLRAVRQLATHFGKSPDRVTEPELRQYLLFLKNDKHFAPASLKTFSCSCGGARCRLVRRSVCRTGCRAKLNATELLAFRLLYHPLVVRLSRMDTATGNSNDSMEAALQRLDQALASARSRKWCRTLWSRFVRLRDDHRCVICDSPDRVAAHHVVRKSFMPEAEFQTGNGATLCFVCHRDHHGSFNGQPNLRLPMDAQGGEQIERLAVLYAVLFDDACTRGLLRDDFYFLSDTVLAKFKMFQGFDPYLEFAGYRIEQARSILLSSIINAQDLVSIPWFLCVA